MKGAKRYIIMFILFALFGDFIANEKPLLVKDKTSGIYSPIFTHFLSQMKGEEKLIQPNWKGDQFSFVLMPIIPYSAQSIDLENSNYMSPFGRQNVKNIGYRHWFGTDSLGRDVFAGLIRGFRIAFLIGMLSMLFALFFGLPLGTLMGYLGDQSWKLNMLQIASIIIMLPYFCFFVITSLNLMKIGLISPAIACFQMIFLLAFIVLIVFGFGRIIKGRQWTIPLDFIGMKLIEVLKSIPGLFLLLALLSLSIHPNILFISFIIGLLRWPGIARYIRAEVWKEKEKDYIKSAKSLGLPEWKVVVYHLMPNAMYPIVVAVAFGFASAILLESALSFLGLGLSLEEMSWGKLLAQGRSRIDAWWLVLFPGMAIFATVYSCNVLGERLMDHLKPSIQDSGL